MDVHSIHGFSPVVKSFFKVFLKNDLTKWGLTVYTIGEMSELSVRGKRHDTDEGRYYTWGGEKFPSVTTILRDAVPKPGLSKWQANLVIDSIIEDQDKFLGMSDAEIRKHLNKLVDSSKDASGAKGSIIHQYADSFANGRELPDVDEEQLHLVKQFENFCYDWKPRFLHTEVPAYSRRFGYAGTADGYVVINDEVYVIDYKTGRSIWPEVALQLAAYRWADFLDVGGVETPLPRISGALVLHVRPDEQSEDPFSPSGYELRRVKSDEDVFNAFLAALDMYRFLHEDSAYMIQSKMEPDRG